MLPTRARGQACDRDMCSSLEWDPGPFSLRAGALSAEPNWPGLHNIFVETILAGPRAAYRPGPRSSLVLNALWSFSDLMTWTLLKMTDHLFCRASPQLDWSEPPYLRFRARVLRRRTAVFPLDPTGWRPSCHY